MNKMDTAEEIKEDKANALQAESKPEVPFKKPTLLIGKIGRLPRKIQTATPSNEIAQKIPDAPVEKDLVKPNEDEGNNGPISNESKTEESIAEKPTESISKSPVQTQAENSPACFYKEPTWSGMPETTGKPYVFEVLKNGSIIETIDLMKKPFWVIGRMANCDICMQHPTISRYHAIIQYRDIPSEDDPPGFYVYDLGSTHGTFLNGKNNKLKPKVYAPIRVGHMLRLGCSQRSYILTGPEDDQEDESELSVTELKQLKAQKIKEHQEKMRQAELDREEKKKRDEEKGIDWGMGDDADEAEDIAENPYASTTNEELYLDDPKKALRGFFEREGIELEYDCREQGMGQFLCKVELPVDDEMGRPIIAEVLHRGKKKEAVVQCALEACRILDRFGVLRQATHESKKRKGRNWEENDYYDSDDDTFLDRTGTIEKKREKRMKVKEPEKAETYESLVAKEKEISASIAEIEKKLGQAQAKFDASTSNASTEEDSLDSYMKGLGEDKPDKQAISKWKLELINLRKTHANVINLANIAKPANLPALVPAGTSASTSAKGKLNLPVFGKRRALPVKFPAKPSAAQENSQTSTEIEEDESEEETEDMHNTKESTVTRLPEQPLDPSIATPSETEEPLSRSSEANSDCCCCCCANTNNDTNTGNPPRTTDDSNLDHSDPVLPETNAATDGDGAMLDSDSSGDEQVEILGEFRPIKTFHDTETFKRFEKIMKTGLPAVADKHKQKLVKILRKLQRLASNEDRMHSDWRILSAKKRKVMKWITELRQSETNENMEKLEFRVSTELNRILDELNMMTEDKCKVIGQVKQMGLALKSISMEIDKDIQGIKMGMHTIKSGAYSSLQNPNVDYQAPSTSKNGDETENANEKQDSSPEDNSEEVDDKKKKKNQKRNEQRQHKAELERQRGYEEDAARENYNMWVPPTDQSGDGRTSLNDKLGY